MKPFPFYKQPDQMDCGPVCLRMIAKSYGKNFSLQRLRDLTGINKDGVSLFGISEAAEKIGFRTNGAKLDISLLKETELPVIIHWNENHFVVLYRIIAGAIVIANPGTIVGGATASAIVSTMSFVNDAISIAGGYNNVN